MSPGSAVIHENAFGLAGLRSGSMLVKQMGSYSGGCASTGGAALGAWKEGYSNCYSALNHYSGLWILFWGGVVGVMR